MRIFKILFPATRALHRNQVIDIQYLYTPTCGFDRLCLLFTQIVIDQQINLLRLCLRVIEVPGDEVAISDVFVPKAIYILRPDRRSRYQATLAKRLYRLFQVGEYLLTCSYLTALV